MWAALALAAALSSDGDAPRLDTIEVTATRAPARAFDVPAAIDVVTPERDVAGVEVSEQIARVPGLVARDRQNLAQDEQISIRGFGARSTFGVRGVRLYVDGIPASLPDGLGQVSQLDLASIARIEVLRGPFSALYGNVSGGVVQVFTASGGAPGTFGIAGAIGSHDLIRATADASGGDDTLAYRVDATRLQRDGYRAHSAARRTLGSARVDWRFGEASTLTVLASGFDAPDAQDPLGLTRAQLHEDPAAASPVAIAFDTRKSARQRQLGAILEQRNDAGDTWRVLAYGGTRDVEQFLAIPIATQANPLHGGGVVDLGNLFDGIDVRWSGKRGPLDLTVGASADEFEQNRLGYENFAGTTLGARGALRRDQRDRVDDLDPYAQASWQATSRLRVDLGVRRSRVRFDSNDRYVTARNPDDSGSARYSATTPVFGAMFAASDELHVYADAGRAFETPTLDELGYRADGGSGLNLALDPARSRHLELGAKWRSSRVRVEAAVFRADTRDELAIATSSGGRTTFQNAGRARRDGAELSLDADLGAGWRLVLAATRLDARFRDAFLTCGTTPCATPHDHVPSGTRLPGVPSRELFAQAHRDLPRGWYAAFDVRSLGDATANNVGDERAAGYAIAGLRGGWARGDVRAFAAIDNVFDRRFIGSVIVNESNRRYYEPGAGRGVSVGLEVRW